MKAIWHSGFLAGTEMMDRVPLIAFVTRTGNLVKPFPGKTKYLFYESIHLSNLSR